MPTCIRDAAARDEAAWRGLWHQYLAFYETTLPDAITAATWQRILDPGSAIFARLAETDGTVTGFAVCLLHEGTWITTPNCYLEDLFVDPAVRGTGVGRLLLEDLLALSRQNGWARLYWNTRADNAVARRLYDRFALADDHVRYRITVA